MRIYNSKTHKKEEFIPITSGKVTMYVCGPTVYDQIHIGNGRTFVSFDMCRRYLIHKGYEVTFAQNLTDVDDKIIQRAQEQGKEATEIAATFSEAFMKEMERLHVLAPDIQPRATHEIDAMIEMIEGLIERGHAYVVSSGDVYFSVRSVATYGAVSGRKVDELLVGARIEENADKRDPLDFALWKAAKPGEPSWKSPWGEGRPGWHTECSAMVHKYLGTPIDIHGGGSDLIFPHHENEAAQASACWNTELAHIWMHAGMLRVEGEKMSKSLGNFYTVKEVLDQYPAPALRLLMAQTHYRSPMDFSFERLRGAVAAWEKLGSTVQNLRWFAKQDARAVSDLVGGKVEEDAKPRANAEGATGGVVGECAKEDGDPFSLGRGGATENHIRPEERLKEAQQAFEEAMDDDFNTAAALAVIFELQTDLNTWLEGAQAGDDAAKEYAAGAAQTLEELLGILGIEIPDDDTDGGVSAGEKLAVLQEIYERYAHANGVEPASTNDDARGAEAASTSNDISGSVGANRFSHATGAQNEKNQNAEKPGDGSLNLLLSKIASFRDSARASKDYATSDAIRDDLIAAGYSVEDTPAGTRIK